jgi:hypothetical protein
MWPVYEFRPLPEHLGSMVFRYADGEWLPDDGEHDIAFISYGMIAPLALYVRLPYQRNIVWSGLTQHWRGSDANHPRRNPWHYMLRDGETEWGGPWSGRDAHPNERAGNAAMSECCRRNRCANGRGPEFVIGDPYIAAGLVRELETQKVVAFPERLSCMYCGDHWDRAHAARLEGVAA